MLSAACRSLELTGPLDQTGGLRGLMRTTLSQQVTGGLLGVDTWWDT